MEQSKVAMLVEMMVDRKETLSVAVTVVQKEQWQVVWKAFEMGESKAAMMVALMVFLRVAQMVAYSAE